MTGLINMVSSEAVAPPPSSGQQAASESQIPNELLAHNESLVHVVMGSLDHAKAEERTLIDLNGKTAIADAMADRRRRPMD